MRPGPPLQIGLDLSEGDKAAIARIDAAVGPPTSKGPQEFVIRVMTYLRRTYRPALPQLPEGPGDRRSAGLRAYVERVRAQQAAEVRTPGLDLDAGGQAGRQGYGRQGGPIA